jgi:hypothetical protein
MPSRRPSLQLFLRVALLGGYLAVAAALSGATGGGFSSTLSDDQRSSAGLSTLTAEQRSALDVLVAGEIAQARKEGGMVSSSTFVSRQSVEQRNQAGLDHLTPDQLTRLNELVASVVSSGPKPRIRPRLKDDEIIRPQKPEIHGSASLTLGWGRNGGNFRASSLWVDYFDPNTGLGLGIGVETFKGKGFYNYYPRYGSPYSVFGTGFYDPFYYGGLRDDFYDDQSSVRGSASWDGVSRHDYRRR